jgi:hypothetical protein
MRFARLRLPRVWWLVAGVRGWLEGGNRTHTRAIGSHDSINVLGFDAINDVVAGSRDEVTIGHDLDLRLLELSMVLLIDGTLLSYS